MNLGKYSAPQCLPQFKATIPKALALMNTLKIVFPVRQKAKTSEELQTFVCNYRDRLITGPAIC